MKNLRYTDNKLTIAAKVLITLIFVWSCFLWSGATIFNFYIRMPEYSHLATGMLTGSILIFISIVLMYFRMYILQLPFCVVGSIFYLNQASEMIDRAIETEIVFKPSFELRYLPEIVVLLLSIALAMIHFWSIESKRIAAKNEFNNSPSKSILDD